MIQYMSKILNISFQIFIACSLIFMQLIVCLCWGFTAQWGHVERGQFT